MGKAANKMRREKDVHLDGIDEVRELLKEENTSVCIQLWIKRNGEGY